MPFLKTIDDEGFRQWRLFWGRLWITRCDGRTTIWLCLGGRKPGKGLILTIRWRIL